MVPVILVEATVGFDAKVRIGVVRSVKNPVILVFPYADPILFKYSRGHAPYSLVFQISEEMMSPCHGRLYASCLGARQIDASTLLYGRSTCHRTTRKILVATYS